MLDMFRHVTAQQIVIGERTSNTDIQQRHQLCLDCEHYRDNVTTGATMPRPCALRPIESACAWRKRMRAGERAGEGCGWGSPGTLDNADNDTQKTAFVIP